MRPHALATGTRTRSAGEQRLDSLGGALVYVPSQCVGARRVPLVVFLHGGGGSARQVIDDERQFADKYGMILFAPNAVSPGRWDILVNAMGEGLAKALQDLTLDQLMQLAAGKQLPGFDVRPRAPIYPDVKNIDRALQYVLQTYAIDPDKIALMGMSDGGHYATFLGLNNLDVFSRIALMSPAGVERAASASPQNATTQFFLMTGMEEEAKSLTTVVNVRREMRAEGHVVEPVVLALRGHIELPENDALMWNWLQQSWRTPGRSVLIAPVATAGADSILTPEVLAKMTAFWKAFMQEPDSIRITGRQAHQRPLLLPFGEEHLFVPLVDMSALEAQYPAVATDLTRAGLTAQQEDAYRAAIISALATSMAAGFVEAVSLPLKRNVEFVQGHPDEMAALRQTRIWFTP